jgi:hypothetical protein
MSPVEYRRRFGGLRSRLRESGSAVAVPSARTDPVAH